MLGKEIHSRIYVISLACLAAGLPLSVFTTSLFQLVLAGNWLLEGRYESKWAQLRSRRSLWLVLSVYLVFLIGLAFSHDLAYAFHDLKIKLPLLALTLVIGTTPSISQVQLKWILLALVAGVFAGSVASIAALTGIIDVDFKDMREISLFVSHIRFSLLINMAIFSLVYLVFKREDSGRRWETPVYLALMIWLVFFLFILQSVTGIIIFLLVSFIIFWIYLHRVWNMLLRWTLALLMISVLVLGLFLVSKSLRRFYKVEHVDRENIEIYTAGGRPYFHDFESDYVENGYFIWLYVCEPELKQEWNRRSQLDYHDADSNGNEIKYTLIRYLTSMGLRKDSVGMSSLSPHDIASIEQGKANYLYSRRWSLYAKVYEILWQIDVYRKGGNPSGHSVTQRILYLEAALGIIRDHLWTGTGTGDVLKAYEDHYERTASQLEKPWRLRAHNQYLTFLVTYGVFGFSWILFSLFYPVFLEQKQRSFLVWIFLMVAFLSWLNEDTLETATGVSFFAFFYALFLFGTEPGKD